MTTVRGLAKLLCTTCNETTLHRAEACIHCSTPNHRSGNPPVPREAFNTHKAANYSAVIQAASDKRRAREARAKALTRMRA
jgi:hypothetical protein